MKSGTNSLHGTAYAFGRDSALEAKNAFLATKQQDQVEQWGMSAGGPIKKDKVFFFANFEKQSYSITPGKTAQVPTSISLGGSSGPSSSFPDAIAAMNLAGVPVSQLSLNLAGCTNPASHPTVGSAIPCNASAGLFGNSTTSATEVLDFPIAAHSNNIVSKIDYTINQNNTVHGEYVYGDGRPIAQSGTVLEPWWQGPYHIRSQVARGIWVWTPNSTWVNEMRFGTDRILQTNNSGDCVPQQFKPPDYAGLGFVSGVSACGFPVTTVGTFTALGSALGSTSLPVFYQGQDAVSRTLGKHVFKFGGGIRQTLWTGSSFAAQRGTLNFAATTATASLPALTPLEAFLAGIPNSTNSAVIPRLDSGRVSRKLFQL